MITMFKKEIFTDKQLSSQEFETTQTEVSTRTVINFSFYLALSKIISNG